jgi:HAD superfamily hydrolase (TIGR01509 family)
MIIPNVIQNLALDKEAPQNLCLERMTIAGLQGMSENNDFGKKPTPSQRQVLNYVGYKTIYFDLGNVILFFSLPKMFSQLGKCSGLSSEKTKELLFHTPLRERYEKGEITTKTLYQAFRHEAVKPFTLAEFTHAFSDIFTPNTELFPLIEELKAKGTRLILLSNTSESHFQFALKNYPILKLFDHYILSYKLGVWKPDVRIFQKALEVAHCAPNECFYTDDIAEFIESASKVGLAGHTFTDAPSLAYAIQKGQLL